MLFVGSMVFSAGTPVYIGVDPNTLSGIAVPTPSLVQGVGTGRSEVTGLACGRSS
jgi:hypothetical protein